MKRFIIPIAVSALTTACCLLVFQFIQNKDARTQLSQPNPSLPEISANYMPIAGIDTSIDLTQAAEKSVHAVVHVKNTTESRQPRSMMDLFLGGGVPRAMIGTGMPKVTPPCKSVDFLRVIT